MDVSFSLHSVECFFLMTHLMTHGVIMTIGRIHIPKEVMAVFERPARHRSRSGEAGGRYLKRNFTGSRNDHRGGVYTAEALGVSFWLI